jgi:hypothetical protein
MGWRGPILLLWGLSTYNNLKTFRRINIVANTPTSPLDATGKAAEKAQKKRGRTP